MKWLLLIIIVFVWDYCEAKTEKECLSEAAQVLNISEEKLTEVMVSCSVKMMEGDAHLMSRGEYWRKIRIKLYPRQYARMLASDSVYEDDMSEIEKAHRAMHYMSCIEFTGAKALYLKKCTSK